MTTLIAGKKAPDFTLPSDLSGKPVRLKDFRGKTVILYFYPKDMTSGCTQQACNFQEELRFFKKKGIVILGVSKDSLKRHAKFREKYSLEFDLLADEDTQVAQAYEVWKEKSLYGRKFMGTERSTFVISPAGVIEHVFRKVKVADHVESLKCLFV